MTSDAAIYNPQRPPDNSVCRGSYDLGMETTISEMTVGAWQARQIEKAARILVDFVEATKEDRLRWRPSTEEASKTRSVLEQVGACVFANVRFRCYLLGETAPAADAFEAFSSVKEAKEALESTADALAVEIRKLGSDDMMREVQTHRGPMPVALAIQIPLRDMVYHMGQINMIQLLYGDMEFHSNEKFWTL